MKHRFDISFGVLWIQALCFGTFDALAECRIDLDYYFIDTYTNVTIDTESCAVLVETSPGNRIIAVIYYRYMQNVQIHDGNSSEGSMLDPRTEIGVYHSILSNGSQIYIQMELSRFLYILNLLSTEDSNWRFNFSTADEDISVKRNGGELLAKTTQKSSIIAVISSINLHVRNYPVILIYDGISPGGNALCIQSNLALVSRGNTMTIECINNCNGFFVEFHSIVSRHSIQTRLQSTGYISSPGYLLYDEGRTIFNLRISWVFISSRPASLSLRFGYFDLKIYRSEEKCVDFVKIDSSHDLNETLCGEIAAPFEYKSISTELTITFEMRSSFPLKDFSLKYKACFKILDDTEGVIVVPPYWDGPLKCVYEIEVDKGKIIEFNISDVFRHDHTNSNCSNQIIIHDGSRVSSKEIFDSCSTNESASTAGLNMIESTGNVLHITFFGVEHVARNKIHVIGRYSYKAVYRQELLDKTGLILLPGNRADLTTECQFTLYVETSERIRLHFNSRNDDNDTCTSVITVSDGYVLAQEVYSGCVFSNLPEFIETTTNRVRVIVHLSDQLDSPSALGYYTGYDSYEEELSINNIVIANLGLVILLITINIIVCTWMKQKKNATGQRGETQRHVVIDNYSVYNSQEETEENPYAECE